MLQGFTEKFNFGGGGGAYENKYIWDAWKGETWIDYRFKGGEECGKKDGRGVDTAMHTMLERFLRRISINNIFITVMIRCFVNFAHMLRTYFREEFKSAFGKPMFHSCT